MKPLAVIFALALLGFAPLFGQATRDRAVELNAVAQESPPRITLQWSSVGYVPTGQKIFRRLKGDAKWTQIASPAVTATSYADNAVSPGVSYEYFVVRTRDLPPYFASSYISAGIRAPLVAERGKVILLVDDTVAPTLSADLALFADDLTGDGWVVVRQDVSPSSTATSVRGVIQSIYASDPAHTVGVILFGHVPVPYSGDFNPDGHSDHQGAWPADVFYGDMDGVWTDATVNNSSASRTQNRNVPGDGKFDQTVIPSDIELQIGRIDLANMPSFSATAAPLLQRYLARDHQYRHRLGAFFDIPRRGLVDDNFGYFGGEAFAVTAWRSFIACVGVGTVQSLDWFGTLATNKYLWAYGCGGGTYTSADQVGTSANFASTDSLAVFNVTFGSYFGDWDNSDNFLRAPLAGTAAGLALTNCWAGRPHWHFHPMALGETIGYAARATQNNDGSSEEGYDANFSARQVHIALLGDPTLRLYPMIPPSNLTATPASQAVSLSWTAPADGPLEGYLVSRAVSPGGQFVRLNGALVAGTSFTDRTATPGVSYRYLVRAVKLETSPTGTFLNPSQGIFSTSVMLPAASGPEMNVTGNGSPITAGDTAPLPGNGTDFGALETINSAAHIFTIANAGVATLNVTGIAITGAQAGDFTITQFPPTTVAAGGTATFQVQFHPSATGARAATLTLTGNDADESSYGVALGGTGIPAHAEIATYPPSIQRAIHAGDSAAETLQISAPGPGTLSYAVASSLANYTARDSDSFAGPAYNWIDLAGTGTELTTWSNLDDDISSAVPIGFAFPFFGNSFTSLRVCTNGFLSFTDTIVAPANAPLPNYNAAANLVAPFWGDLILISGTSHVYYGSSGGNFVVQYENVALWANQSARLSFEAILKPSGEIIFQYKTLNQPGTLYGIGIQNGTRDVALGIANGVAYAHPGLAIRIRPPGAETWLALGSTSGSVAPSAAQPVSVTLNSAGLAPGNYYAELTVASNAQTNPEIVLPVRFTVGNTPVENWRLAHFNTASNAGTAADDANPDGDACNNLLEYAFGTDPASPNANGSPVISRNAGGYLQVQFSRDATRTDLRYFVEASTNLNSGWTPIASGVHGAPVIATGAHSAIESGAGDVKSVLVEDTAPAGTFPTRYLRVRVVRD